MDRCFEPTVDASRGLRAAAVLLAAAVLATWPPDGRAMEPGTMPVAVDTLVAEAIAHNPEIVAAQHEQDAARQRAAAAGALEDPMLEAGVVNAALPFSLRRDDMTMKMLGLSQKLPYPGKRSLREAVATAESRGITHATNETVDRVCRDVRVAYEELRFADASAQIAARTGELLRQLAAVAGAQYALGRGQQIDVLRAQSEVARLQQELLRIEADRVARSTELERLLGRRESGPTIVPLPATLLVLPQDPATLPEAALEHRPRLQALDALIEKSEREIDLARREYYPDFELRLGYGQRERTLDGMPRDDMITMTVAVNLPLWRKSRLDPRVAEARAMRAQAVALADAQRVEIRTGLTQQLAVERTARQAVELYRTLLQPQARAAAESALHAYQFGRSDFQTLLDARLREYATALAEAEAVATHNKAIAEIEFLAGIGMPAAAHVGGQP